MIKKIKDKSVDDKKKKSYLAKLLSIRYWIINLKLLTRDIKKIYKKTTNNKYVALLISIIRHDKKQKKIQKKQTKPKTKNKIHYLSVHKTYVIFKDILVKYFREKLFIHNDLIPFNNLQKAEELHDRKKQKQTLKDEIEHNNLSQEEKELTSDKLRETEIRKYKKYSDHYMQKNFSKKEKEKNSNKDQNTRFLNK